MTTTRDVIAQRQFDEEWSRRMDAERARDRARRESEREKADGSDGGGDAGQGDPVSGEASE